MSAVNDFIRTHKLGTAFGNAVVQRYASNTQMLKNATSPTELAKFEGTVALFRKYSAEYNVDYLLMMAQAFQSLPSTNKRKVK